MPVTLIFTRKDKRRLLTKEGEFSYTFRSVSGLLIYYSASVMADKFFLGFAQLLFEPTWKYKLDEYSMTFLVESGG